ncbi:hypothetical protein BBROOKSOX_677 [Bathymodiolus brooksi thiotrophic gill symbiont]|nr:hypothetical protein BBROOKSOX_677 [Bathymodiolus brooksi thiotrophic gill symbiont]
MWLRLPCFKIFLNSDTDMRKNSDASAIENLIQENTHTICNML